MAEHSVEHKTPKLTKNAARCGSCKEVVESKSVHDFKRCSCGRLSVDGGLDYLRRVHDSSIDYEELSEYSDV